MGGQRRNPKDYDDSNTIVRRTRRSKKTEFQERGRLLDEEYNDIFKLHNVDQQRLNTVARECDQRPNREGLIEALVDQINFDSQMRKKYDDVHQKERNLRREVTSYFRETRTKLLQIPEEPPQPSKWTLKPDEPSRREEIKQAQHQAQRPPVKWPPLPERETP